MKHSLIILFAAVLGLAGVTALNNAPPVNAGEATVQPAESEEAATFAVENMTCSACPITVRTAMERVEGVISVTVDYESKTATVVFDPSIAATSDIAKASTDVGYPAQVIEG